MTIFWLHSIFIFLIFRDFKKTKKYNKNEYVFFKESTNLLT